MAILLLLALLACLAALVPAAYLLGFRLGGAHWYDRLVETRLAAAKAERQLHDLTRQAFVAMAEHAQESQRFGQ